MRIPKGNFEDDVSGVNIKYIQVNGNETSMYQVSLMDKIQQNLIPSVIVLPAIISRIQVIIKVLLKL